MHLMTFECIPFRGSPCCRTYSTSYAGTLRHAPKRQTDGAPTVGTITQLSPRRPAVPRFSEATSDNSVSGVPSKPASRKPIDGINGLHALICRDGFTLPIQAVLV